jgi:hypothetical protein
MTDRFTSASRRKVERRFLDAGDELRASLAYEAMSDINLAEDSIRRAAQRLRDRADDAERSLNAGSFVSSLSVGSLSEDANAAIARREAAFKTLSRIMSQGEITVAMADGQEA